MLAFGFSNNYYVGLLCRLLYGLSDGTMNVSKTMLAELSNSRNISLGTSFIFVGSAIGRIIGPLCSSYLTDKSVIAPFIRKFHILEKVTVSSTFQIETLFIAFPPCWNHLHSCGIMLSLLLGRYNFQGRTGEGSKIQGRYESMESHLIFIRMNSQPFFPKTQRKGMTSTNYCYWNTTKTLVILICSRIRRSSYLF